MLSATISDHSWFASHPLENFRIRDPWPGEFPDLTPRPGHGAACVLAIAHRDDTGHITNINRMLRFRLPARGATAA
jgi:hypothetical protein